MILQLNTLSHKKIYLLAIIASLFLSWISYYFFLSIGLDGILYLRSAEAYHQGGLSATMTFYQWPFYAILIAAVHKIGLSYVASAGLIDAILQAGIVYFFIRIILHFNPHPRMGIWALLCILCFMPLNGLRGFFYRDFGYWAFYLAMLYYAFAFLRTEKQCALWLFGLMAVLAILFRIEGVVIALTIILTFFFVSSKSFLRRCMNSSIMAWPFFCGLLIWIFNSHSLYGGGRLSEIYAAVVSGLSNISQVTHQATALIQQALHPFYPFVHAKQMYFPMVVGFLIYKIALTTTFGYVALALYGAIKNNIPFKTREKILISIVLMVQLGVLFFFLLNHLFLTERYILALSLILLWWVPFGIEKVYQQVIAMPRAIKKTSIITLVSLFFIATFLAGFIHIGTSKRHIDKAIVWLKPRIAEEDRVLTNNHLVLYQLKGSISTWKEDFVNFDKKGEE